MADAPRIAAYLESVRSALGDLPARERREVLAELEALLAAEVAERGEQAALDAVGPAHAYAAAVRSALARDEDPAGAQGRVLGMPYDFRGLSTDRIAARIWNPADPRIFMPRLFGVGWTINFGAIAVRLGLMRPDDTDDDVFERVPAAAIRVALAVPAALAAATAALLAAAWRTLPASVPVHWGVSGAPDDWAPKASALGLLLALTVLPIVLAYVRLLRRGTARRTQILWAAALSVLSVLGLGIAAITVADADGGHSGNYMWVVIVAGLGLSFLQLYVPARLGMRAEWRESRPTEQGRMT